MMVTENCIDLTPVTFGREVYFKLNLERLSLARLYDGVSSQFAYQISVYDWPHPLKLEVKKNKSYQWRHDFVGHIACTSFGVSFHWNTMPTNTCAPGFEPKIFCLRGRRASHQVTASFSVIKVMRVLLSDTDGNPLCTTLVQYHIVLNVNTV